MELELIEIIAVVLVGVAGLTGVGAWLLKKGVAIGAAKVADSTEKAALALDSVAAGAKAAGLEKVGVVVEEFADVPDELGDVATQIAHMTKNQDFTTEAFLKLFDEGQDVFVEGKDFVLKVIKKN
jgi:hypothetical protein